MNKPIWAPTRKHKDSSRLAKFIKTINARHCLHLQSYDELHLWSVQKKELFWGEVWDFCQVIGNRGDTALIESEDMMSARFLPYATLNFAENLLRRRGESEAIIFVSEDETPLRVSWNDLYDRVSKLSQALHELGVKPGDRVAAVLPNGPAAVTAMLATSSLGAIWSSCSPDFGAHAVLDRFAQIEPKVLFACDGYQYGGKTYQILPKVQQIASKLKNLVRVIVVPAPRPVGDDRSALRDGAGEVYLDDLLKSYQASFIDFQRFPFSHPLYILFSSGTTGPPKCIVHSAGGTLIQHMKEHQLQSDIKPGDRVFYFTTCTWMMWNWLVSALASEATLLLYDGAPFYPEDDVLFSLADKLKATHFGTSAKYIEELGRRNVHPREKYQLSNLRFIASTGSPLLAGSFDFIYEHVKSDVYLSSIAGGTDIISCFVGGSPLSEIRRGEIPCAGLGMAVEVWSDSGQSVMEEKGELVCTEPFPSMPIEFWGDTSAKKYRQAYFEKFPGVWAHGDFAKRTKRNGFIIYGRSDATLNPGGVRIGTAEIYRQVDKVDSIVDSVVIGQSWDGDVRVVLFVVLREGLQLTAEIEKRLKHQLRTGASPRHVPAKIISVSEIPRTKSGKISELAVKAAVDGLPLENADALANPGSLDEYRGLAELSF